MRARGPAQLNEQPVLNPNRKLGVAWDGVGGGEKDDSGAGKERRMPRMLMQPPSPCRCRSVRWHDADMQAAG